MNNKNLKLLILFLCLGQLVWAQDVMYNTANETLMQKDYSKVQGSPYLFKDWHKGTLYDIKDKPTAATAINFNGDTGKVVMQEDDKIIELNENLYNRIELMVDGKKEVLVNRVTPIDLTYYRAIYQSEMHQALERFESDLKEDEVGTYAASSKRAKFMNKTKFYLFKDGKLHQVNRNNKKIIDFLKSPRLKGYLKKNKLNLKKDEDLVKALAYYESSMLKNN